MSNKIFLFDVESLGLHGEGFAFAFGIFDADTKLQIEVKSFVSKEGLAEAKKNPWLMKNSVPLIQERIEQQKIIVVENNYDLKEQFWNELSNAKTKYGQGNLQIWSDCIYPVESNFLEAVYKNCPQEREWEMPYPVKDVATICDISISRTAVYKSDYPDSIIMEHEPMFDVLASWNVLAKNEYFS